MFGICDCGLACADDERLRKYIKKKPTILLYVLRNNYSSELALQLIRLDPACCDVVDKDETPLIYACRTGLTRVALAILEADPTGKRGRVHHVDSEGRTALFWAVNPWPEAMLEVLSRLLKIPEVDFKRVDKAGDSLLSLAIKKGLLVSSWVKCGHFDLLHLDASGNTLLMTALLSMHTWGSKWDPDLIPTLLAQPDILRNVGHANKAGQTALMVAVYANGTTILSQLLATGRALPLHRDRSGKHALFLAVEAGLPLQCHVLLDTGLYNPYDRDDRKISLLELACQKTLYDVIARLSDNNVTLLKKVTQDVEDKRREEERRRQEEEEALRRSYD